MGKENVRQKTEPKAVVQPVMIERRQGDSSRMMKVLLGVAAGALVIWYAGQVLLLIFAGILLAIVLRRGAMMLAKELKVKPGIGLLLVILSLVTIVTLVGVTLAPQILQEGRELLSRLPQQWARFQGFFDQLTGGALSDLTNTLSGLPGTPGQAAGDTAATAAGAGNAAAGGIGSEGQAVAGMVGGSPAGEAGAAASSAGNGLSGSSGVIEQVVPRMLGLLSSTIGALGSIVMIVVTGIYLAADPGTYRRGFISLMPPVRRARTAEILDMLEQTLFNWMVGMVVAMGAIGLFTWVGLALLGVPLSLVLGLIAGLLNFVPNIGPILSGVPAVLLTVGGEASLLGYVLLLYVVVQGLESYVLTPMIQERTIALPPVLTLTAQLVMALMAGVIGLLLATPLAAVGLVLVRELYVKDYLEGGVGGDAKAEA